MVFEKIAKGQDGQLVQHFLERSTAELPEKTAVVHNEQRATYAEVNARANAVADWLIENGTVRGDRVVLMMENGLDYIAGYYGALKAGAAAVPLSPELKAPAIGPIVSELAPKAVIASKRPEAEIKALDPDLLKGSNLLIRKPKLKWDGAVLVHSWDDLANGGPGADPLVNVAAGDLASIIYTSGSTGKPKGVMLTHANITANTASICSCLRIGCDDIQMVVLPFHYVMGKSLLNTHFAAGATIIINNSFAFPASVVKQLVDENVTAFSGVPSTFAYLLHRSPLKKFRDRLTALRYCSQAGGHMSAAIKQELRKVLPDHTKIYIMYGATEASARLTCLEPERYEEKMNSIGKPIPGVTLRVLGPDGREVPVGETGELVAHGHNITRGYWKDEASSAKALDENGYHTGDLGYQDEDGYFYVKGRKDNLLKVGGHRINPQEIEDALMETELLIETVVLGLSDALRRHRLVALGCPKSSDCSEKLILSECAKKLPKYKMPSEVRFLRALPKNANGKIDRNKCFELLDQEIHDFVHVNVKTTMT